MAFKINTTTIMDSTGVTTPTFTTATRPSSPTQGQVIYNSDIKALELYDSGYWIRVTDGGRPFLYRTIITTGYVYGGYQSTSPWKNVNRLVHATDVMTNLGDLLDRPAAYTSGVCNLTRAFLWGTDTAWPGTTTVTSAFNMNTETGAGLNTNWNTRAARNDCGTVFKETQFGYILGGGSTDIDVFNLTNETMYQSSTGPDSMAGDSMQSGVATLSDEIAGYAWGDASHKLLFSTTVAHGITDTTVNGSGSQQKGINSKVGKGYCGNEGTYNGGNNLRRWSFATDTNIGNVAKPITNSGEENFDMGQDRQYMYGCYDGAQNNRGWKFSYSTDSGTELGSGSIRTGVPGGSSGHCGWKG